MACGSTSGNPPTAHDEPEAQSVGWDFAIRPGVPMDDEPLRATQAARRLGISNRDLIGLGHRRKIRCAMQDGIAQVPLDAVEEYQAAASQPDVLDL